SSSDRALFATALAAARPFGAHLEVLHMRPDPGTAALYAPHVEFAQGAALRRRLQPLSRLLLSREHRDRASAFRCAGRLRALAGGDLEWPRSAADRRA